MTSIFLVRHAQPDVNWKDGRTRPLTNIGLEDSRKVTLTLEKYNINMLYSSPYKRSMDTIIDLHK